MNLGSIRKCRLIDNDADILTLRGACEKIKIEVQKAELCLIDMIDVIYNQLLCNERSSADSCASQRVTSKAKKNRSKITL